MPSAEYLPAFRLRAEALQRSHLPSARNLHPRRGVQASARPMQSGHLPAASSLPSRRHVPPSAPAHMQRDDLPGAERLHAVGLQAAGPVFSRQLPPARRLPRRRRLPLPTSAAGLQCCHVPLASPVHPRRLRRSASSVFAGDVPPATHLPSRRRMPPPVGFAGLHPRQLPPAWRLPRRRRVPPPTSAAGLQRCHVPPAPPVHPRRMRRSASSVFAGDVPPPAHLPAGRTVRPSSPSPLQPPELSEAGNLQGESLRQASGWGVNVPP